MRPVLFLAALLAAAVSCGDSPGGPGDWEVTPPENPLPAGDRLFGITVTENEDGFLPSFEVAQEAGLQLVELNIPWDSIETGPGTYQDPYGGALAATAFYGAEGVQVFLSLAVVNTVFSCVPDYLDSLPFSSPEVIAACEGMLDFVMSSIPGNVTVAGISIGNEIDLVLESYDDWVDYIVFFAEVADYARSAYPGIPVGGKCTVMNGVLGVDSLYVEALNEHSDIVMLTYYPQDGDFQALPPAVVHSHLSAVCQAFPEKEVWLCEAGYQSGQEYCASSEEQQAEFFHELFTAWDCHASQVGLIKIDWLHDISPEALAGLLEYYGFSNPGFVEYLATLGLRNYDGTDKYAWLQVLAETDARGW